MENKVNVENITIEEMELSVRTYNILKVHNILQIGDFHRYSEEDLKNLYGIGKTSFNEIMNRLSYYGVVLKDNIRSYFYKDIRNYKFDCNTILGNQINIYVDPVDWKIYLNDYELNIMNYLNFDYDHFIGKLNYSHLIPRNNMILLLFTLHNRVSLEDISKFMGITPERVKQIIKSVRMRLIKLFKYYYFFITHYEFVEFDKAGYRGLFSKSTLNDKCALVTDGEKVHRPLKIKTRLDSEQKIMLEIENTIICYIGKDGLCDVLRVIKNIDGYSDNQQKYDEQDDSIVFDNLYDLDEFCECEEDLI